MSRDSNDFYEKIRKINEQNRLLSGSGERDDSIPNDPQKVTFDDLKDILSLNNCRAGLLLLLWTVSPALIGFVSPELMLTTIFCIYPIVAPVVWFLVGWWKPASLIQSVGLDLVGHVLLFVGIFWNLSGKVGNNIFFGFDILVIMIIVWLIILSTIVSVFVLLFGAYRSERR